MYRARLTLALVLTVLVSACHLTGDGDGGGGGGTIEGVRWILTSHRAAGAMKPVPAGVTADATFKGGTVSGSGGCNGYSATYTASGAKLSIGLVSSTMMACDGPRSEVEAAYLPALQAAASFSATAKELTIRDGAGAATLTFVAAGAR